MLIVGIRLKKGYHADILCVKENHKKVSKKMAQESAEAVISEPFNFELSAEI